MTISDFVGHKRVRVNSVQFKAIKIKVFVSIKHFDYFRFSSNISQNGKRIAIHDRLNLYKGKQDKS